MTITTFDKLSPQDQSLVRLAMQYRDNAYTPYSHHQVGASVRTASGTCYGGCNVEVISLQTTCHQCYRLHIGRPGYTSTR